MGDLCSESSEYSEFSESSEKSPLLSQSVTKNLQIFKFTETGVGD